MLNLPMILGVPSGDSIPKPMQNGAGRILNLNYTSRSMTTRNLCHGVRIGLLSVMLAVIGVLIPIKWAINGPLAGDRKIQRFVPSVIKRVMPYATRAVGAKFTPEYRLYVGMM